MDIRIRLNWKKLRVIAGPSRDYDRKLNRMRPWLLRPGRMYYVAGERMPSEMVCWDRGAIAVRNIASGRVHLVAPETLLTVPDPWACP